MSGGGPISVASIEAALAIADHLREYPTTQNINEAVQYLTAGPAHVAGFDYRRGVELIGSLGIHTFARTPSYEDDFRRILREYIACTRPLWALTATKGRTWCERALDPDTYQCLAYGGLFDEPASHQAVSWWDDLARQHRSSVEATRVETGREGERLTLNYERRRLSDLGFPSVTPVWAALNDNTLGYDVQSWDVDGDELKPVMIESKAFSTAYPRFFITSGEWQAALDFNPSYRFHVWDLNKADLLELQVQDVAPHIPTNQGSGAWRQVEITLGSLPQPS
jgi:hypothetical protein